MRAYESNVLGRQVINKGSCRRRGEECKPSSHNQCLGSCQRGRRADLGMVAAADWAKHVGDTEEGKETLDAITQAKQYLLRWQQLQSVVVQVKCLCILKERAFVEEMPMCLEDWGWVIIGQLVTILPADQSMGTTNHQG
jgi:hypothetical protein